MWGRRQVVRGWRMVEKDEVGVRELADKVEVK